MTAIRFKVDLPADHKNNDTGLAIRAGADMKFDDDEAQAYVDGGFADLVDDRGNVVAEAADKKGNYAQPSNPGQTAAVVTHGPAVPEPAVITPTKEVPPTRTATQARAKVDSKGPTTHAAPVDAKKAAADLRKPR